MKHLWEVWGDLVICKFCGHSDQYLMMRNGGNIPECKGIPSWALSLEKPEELKIETDPTGRSAKEPGSKLDAGKPRVSEVLSLFAKALWAVSCVGTFGAEKYTMGSWKEVPNGMVRYANARMRHMLKKMMGETHDPDSKLPHLAQECWNSLAELELYLEENPEEMERLL